MAAPYRVISSSGARSPISSVRMRYFAKFWKNGPDAPRESDWIDLIGDEPTLILLDELPPYFDFAPNQAGWRRHSGQRHHICAVELAVGGDEIAEDGHSWFPI